MIRPLLTNPPLYHRTFPRLTYYPTCWIISIAPASIYILITRFFYFFFLGAQLYVRILWQIRIGLTGDFELMAELRTCPSFYFISVRFAFVSYGFKRFNRLASFCGRRFNWTMIWLMHIAVFFVINCYFIQELFQ